MKSKVFFSILALAAVMMVAGCAPAGKDVSQLQECTATLDGVFLTRGGGEFVVVSPVLTISNPNPFDVVVSDITYKLDTGQYMQVYDKLPYQYYVPSGDKVVLSGIGCLSFVDAVTDKVMNGALPAKLAAGQLLPFWKGLGGKAPTGVTPQMWGGIEGRSVTYTYELNYLTSADGARKQTIARGSWPPEK